MNVLNLRLLITMMSQLKEKKRTESILYTLEEIMLMMLLLYLVNCYMQQ